MSGYKYEEEHPAHVGDTKLLGIIRVLITRLGGYAVIEAHDMRQGCLNPPLIIPQKNGDVIIHSES